MTAGALSKQNGDETAGFVGTAIMVIAELVFRSRRFKVSTVIYVTLHVRPTVLTLQLLVNLSHILISL